MPPPIGNPPLLLNLDYAKQQPALPQEFGDMARYVDGSLRISSNIPDGSQGMAAAQLEFSDVTFQAELRLIEGGEDDLYGIFLRSPSSELYYVFAVSPSAHIFVASYDNQFLPTVSGPLDPELPFAHGVGQANRFGAIAIGPSLTFLLNGTLITSEIVDERYREGYLGFFVHHGMSSPRAEMAVEWIQVRGIFPPG
jgi:hypothetical protein